MKFSLLSATLFIGVLQSQAQTPSTTVTTWKNDAKGAYDIIHDDFGDYSTQGIQNYADSMHFNRGLKFTFGAITSQCESNSAIYPIAKKMLERGHEIINHSHTHSCAVGNADCGGTGTNYEWAVPGTTDKLSIEVDYSHNSIKTGTGYIPRYYIYPYDQFNDNANSYLKAKGYIGSRTGKYNAANDANFDSDVDGFFRPALVVDVAKSTNGTFAVNLNYWIDEAITKNLWVSRELHNVGSTGWGSVSVDNYRTHLNYVKSKVVAGDLWVGTISEILTYQIQKKYYSKPTTVYSSANKDITISWPKPVFDVSAYLSPLQIKTPVTLKVNLDGLTAKEYIITQAGKEIKNKKVKNGFIYFDAYPHEGSILIKMFDCSSLCIISNPENQTVSQGAASVSFTVGIIATNPTVNYQWMKNNVNIQGATGAVLKLSNILLADSGLYAVKINSGGVNQTSTAGKLTVIKVFVSNTTPYTTNIPIPGKVESEFYDNGGQNKAYYDVTTANQGDATSFRSGTSVDIERCTDGGVGYNIGYAVAGEWLKYTVDVSKTQNYDVEFRYATLTPNTSVRIYLNDDPLTGNINLPTTGGWATFKSVMVNNLRLEGGIGKVLKLEVMSGDPNLNYYNFTVSLIQNLDEEKLVQLPKMSVYPNPSNKSFTVTGVEEGKIQLFSSEGEIVKEIDIEKNTNSIFIDDNLPQGIYFVKYIGLKNTQTVRLVRL